MPHWPLLFLAATLKQRAAALVATPNVEQLVNQRTAQHHGLSVAALAQVGGLGEVHVEVPQGPITKVLDGVVYGSVVFNPPLPEVFVENTEVQTAVRKAIQNAAVGSIAVKSSSARLVEFRASVRVDFETNFGINFLSRQAFINKVVSDGASALVTSICSSLPPRFKDKCALPDESTDDDRLVFEPPALVEEAREVGPLPKPVCSATIDLTVDETQEIRKLLKDPNWHEAVALAISDVADVSRLQVGTMMATKDKDHIQLDFWLTWRRRTKETCQAFLQNGIKARATINTLAIVYWQEWRWLEEKLESISVFGRLMLQVPTPKSFAGNATVAKSVRSIFRDVAVSPGSEAWNLNVKNADVSLKTVGNNVEVNYAAQFANPRDRKVFTGDFTRNGGRELADLLNQRLPDTCKGECKLPGGPKAVTVHTGFPLWNRRPKHFASSPAVQEAIAMAVAQVASVPVEEVGIASWVQRSTLIMVSAWVTSSRVAHAKDGLKRISDDKPAKFLNVARCIVAKLDKLNHQVGLSEADHAFGSVVLRVPNAELFVKDPPDEVMVAIRDAVAEVVKRPRGKVSKVLAGAVNDGEKPTKDVVRVYFNVDFGARGVQNVTAAFAVNGGQTLAKAINDKLPKTFKGKCQPPDATQAASPAFNSQPHGTMMAYVLDANTFVMAREIVAEAIASVALVKPSQVGILMTVPTPFSVQIDFWVVSNDATLRQAAVERVNKKWTMADFDRLSATLIDARRTPAFMAIGGTVKGGHQRHKC